MACFAQNHNFLLETEISGCKNITNVLDIKKQEGTVKTPKQVLLSTRIPWRNYKSKLTITAYFEPILLNYYILISSPIVVAKSIDSLNKRPQLLAGQLQGLNQHRRSKYLLEAKVHWFHMQISNTQIYQNRSIELQLQLQQSKSIYRNQYIEINISKSISKSIYWNRYRNQYRNRYIEIESNRSIWIQSIYLNPINLSESNRSQQSNGSTASAIEWVYSYRMSNRISLQLQQSNQSTAIESAI